MPRQIPTVETTFAFGKIGLLSFGGPAAQISVMHRVLVEEKRWLTEEQFLHALNFCMLLPGPEAMQLATYAGWLLNGVRGGLIAGILFIVPGLIMMLALSAIYISFGTMPLVEGVFFGLKAAVLVIVAQALFKVSNKALSGGLMVAIAVLAFVCIAFLKLPFPAIVLSAGVLGALFWVLAPGSLPLKPAHITDIKKLSQKQHFGTFLRAIAIWGALWIVPLVLLKFVLGGGHIYAKMGLFFSQVAMVTFGGAYAVLAYVAQHAVEAQNWLSTNDMLTGLGLAETTLGPLVLVLVFVGFMGGATADGGVSLWGGLCGGLIAAFFTFVPCFLWIFASATYVERLRHVLWLQASLATITAAVVGVIANLAVWFGMAVLFGSVGTLNAGPFTLPSPDFASVNWLAMIIAVASAVALLRYHINILIVLAFAAIAGCLSVVV